MSDNSGISSDYIQVVRGAKVLASGRTDFGPAEGGVYWVAWRVPRKVKGPLKFCVRSTDQSGNRSDRSCARLTLR